MEVLETNQTALSDTITEDRQEMRLSVELAQRSGQALPSVEGEEVEEVEVEGDKSER